MIEHQMEHIFTYSAALNPPEVVGEVPEGLRVNYWVAGGDVDGSKLKGKLLPVGADWLTVRRDGMAVLDVRISVVTQDGVLIDVTYPGLGDMGADGYEKACQGELPKRMKLYTSPRFRTSHPDYQWMHRTLFFGIGEVDFDRSEVMYDVYAMR